MKTIMSLSALALLVSSLYASPANNSCASKSCSQKTYEKSCNTNSCAKKVCGTQSCNTNTCDSKKMKHHKGQKSHVIGAIMHLDLTDEQRAEIKKIFEAKKEQRVSVASAFKDGKFDKELFIETKKQKREKKIEQKAELIAAMYDVLTDQQKKELQSILEKKQANKKSCRG